MPATIPLATKAIYGPLTEPIQSIRHELLPLVREWTRVRIFSVIRRTPYNLGESPYPSLSFNAVGPRAKNTLSVGVRACSVAC
jgi:hypothetical protein